MSRFSKEDLSKVINSITNLLNEEVFGVINDFLELHPDRRAEINCAFPFPKLIRIGLLKKHMVIEYCGPEEKESDLISVQGEDKPLYGIEDFLEMDLKHEVVNRFKCNEPIENMSFFIGRSVEHLTDYFYDWTQVPYECICMNGMIDFDSIENYTYISNSTFFWTTNQDILKIRRVDFMEIIPFTEEGIAYYDEKTIGVLTKLIIEKRVPQYNVKLHKYLNEFIELINLQDTNEVEITNFLTKHPEILQYAFGINKLNPQVLLEWQYDSKENNLKPDFMPQRMDGYCDIMEFKMPHLSTKFMVGTNERKHPSYLIDSAVAQVNKYSEWCSQKVNTMWLEDTHKIKVCNPIKYLIIGHSNELEAEERRKLREERNIVIYTYDEFIEMARYQIYRYR